MRGVVEARYVGTVKFVAKKLAKQKDETEEHEDLISYHLHRTLCADSEPKWRADGRIHASDLSREDFCPRFFALRDVTGLPQKSVTYLATVDHLVFAQGRMHATMVIDWAARAGIAWGFWSCVQCGYQTGLQPRPTKCHKCQKQTVWRYREVVVRSDFSGVSGGLDLLVQLPGRDKLLVVELKSYPKEKFQALKMPLAEHRERTNLYLRLVDECGLPGLETIDTTEARVLYVTKGGWGRKSGEPKAWGLKDRGWTPFHEFTVKRDDSATEYLVEKARPYWAWRVDGESFPKGICPHALSSVAQNCDYASACFSGKFK